MKLVDKRYHELRVGLDEDRKVYIFWAYQDQPINYLDDETRYVTQEQMDLWLADNPPTNAWARPPRLPNIEWDEEGRAK